MQSELAFVLIIFCVLVGFTVGGVLLVDKYSCKSSALQNGVEYRWGPMAGCSYKHAETGLWIPKENYRAVGD